MNWLATGMTHRQKFWLKVVLTATVPVWALPAFVVMFFVEFVSLTWKTVGEFVERVL